MIDRQTLNILRGELSRNRIYVPGQAGDEERWKVTVGILEALIQKVDELSASERMQGPFTPDPAPEAAPDAPEPPMAD